MAQKHEFAVELDVQACCGIGLLLDFGANVSLIDFQLQARRAMFCLLHLVQTQDSICALFINAT